LEEQWVLYQEYVSFRGCPSMAQHLFLTVRSGKLPLSVTRTDDSMPREHQDFIGEEWVAPLKGGYFYARNPARTEDLIGRFPRSGEEDVDSAVQAAKRGFEVWRKTPAPSRGDILRKAGDLLSERKEELACAAIREMGRPSSRPTETFRRGSTRRTMRPQNAAAHSGSRSPRSYLTNGRRAFGAHLGCAGSSPQSISPWRSRPGRSFRRLHAGTAWYSSPPKTLPTLVRCSWSSCSRRACPPTW